MKWNTRARSEHSAWRQGPGGSAAATATGRRAAAPGARRQRTKNLISVTMQSWGAHQSHHPAKQKSHTHTHKPASSLQWARPRTIICRGLVKEGDRYHKHSGRSSTASLHRGGGVADCAQAATATNLAPQKHWYAHAPRANIQIKDASYAASAAKQRSAKAQIAQEEEAS